MISTIQEPGELTKILGTEYTQVFGPEVVKQFAALTARLWDPTLGLVIFSSNEPVFISSCVMDVFQARDRCDTANVPSLTGTDWDYYGINESTLPKVAVHGDVAVVFLGERKTPYPKRPLAASETEVLSNLGSDLFLAGQESMSNSNFQACFIRDDGYVMKMAPRLPNLLGYGTADTRWIPSEWFEPVKPGPSGRGTSEIVTASGSTRTLEWLRVPIPRFNLFWVRPLRR